MLRYVINSDLFNEIFKSGKRGVTTDDKPWFHDIKCFLQIQEYPPGASNKE